jgi:hypothetical protein
VPDRKARFEGPRVAGAHDRMHLSFYRGDFTIKDVNKPVLGAMSVLYGGASTGLDLLNQCSKLS